MQAEARVGFDSEIVAALSPKAQLIEREYRHLEQGVLEEGADLGVVAGERKRDFVAVELPRSLEELVLGHAQGQAAFFRDRVELGEPVRGRFLALEEPVERLELRLG